MVDGAAGMAQFTDQRVNSPDVVAMRERVRFDFDDSLSKDTASVTLHLKDGRQVSHTTGHNKGTPGNPMTDDELSAKFVDLASLVLGGDRSRRILDDLWRFDELAQIDDLIRSCGMPS
jgi:2-methylcitrate dehydratase PrpD